MSAPSEGMTLEQVIEQMPPEWGNWEIASRMKTDPRLRYRVTLHGAERDAIGYGESVKLALLEALLRALGRMS